MTPAEMSDNLSPQQEQEPETAPSNQPHSPAEWVSLAIASILLSGVIGLVSYLWANDQQRQPPTVQVTPLATRQSGGQYYVPFEVTNQGGETAEEVQVVAELQIDGETVESGEQVLSFLSSEEKASGAFIFTRDPQLGELVIRVASYQDP